MNYTAIRFLQEKPVVPYLSLGFGLMVAVACGVALAFHADLAVARLLSSLAAIAVLLLISAELMLFYNGRGIAHWSMGTVTLLFVAAFVVRVGAALTQEPAPLTAMVNDGTERSVFILAFLGTVIGAINFVLMASDEFNKELTKLANTDGLTGVLNRRRFLEVGAVEFRRARRYRRPLTVLIIDIDRFKAINDRAGHPFGDRVIRAVADCCAGQLREEDRIGRMGGEEFAILLPETAAGAGERTAERLRAAIERDIAPLVAERGLTVTCSVGGVTLDDEHASFDDLIARSDAALYRAKDEGRNLVRFDQSGVAKTAASA